MPLLTADVRLQLAERLRGLSGQVQLTLFTSAAAADEEMNQVFRDLAAEVAGVHPAMSVAEFAEDSPQARADGIHRFPTLTLLGSHGQGSGVRFAGLPGGYEFSSLIEDITDLSAGRTSLSEATRAQVQAIDRDLHIMVFVTPTCPYCPRAVRLAHQLAMENPHITAEAVDASHFTDVTRRFRVMGVPKTVVNDGAVQFEGAMPEPQFLRQILNATAKTA